MDIGKFGKMLANLSMTNAKLTFDSFSQIQERVHDMIGRHLMNDLGTGPSHFQEQRHKLTSWLKDAFTSDSWTTRVFHDMDRMDIRDMFSDVQTVVSGIHSVEVITTLGLRVALTLNNVNLLDMLPSLSEVDACEPFDWYHQFNEEEENDEMYLKKDYYEKDKDYSETESFFPKKKDCSDDAAAAAASKELLVKEAPKLSAHAKKEHLGETIVNDVKVVKDVRKLQKLMRR
jgi:hypothetical protein